MKCEKHRWRFGRSKKAHLRARECMKCGKTQAYLTEGSTQYVDVDVEVTPVPEWIWANPHWRKDWPEKKWEKLLGEEMPVTPDLEKGRAMTDLYICPFCDTEMEKKEMQSHVGIPLCIEMRKKNTKMAELETMGGTVPVRELEFEYFGAKGLRDLMAYTIQRDTLGHPDRGKVTHLEGFVDHSED